MLIAKDITKSYPTPRGELSVLSGMSLSLTRGDAIAIMGPSGSGKSTLLYILGALEPPTAGTVTLDGKNPFRLGEREQAAFRNQHIGFVFQDHSLLPQCSVLENVLTPTLAAAEGDGNPARRRAARARDSRSGRPHGSPRSSSWRAVGRREAARRDGARAHPQPAVLLCDEPTGNLDRTSASCRRAASARSSRPSQDDPRRCHTQRQRLRSDFPSGTRWTADG